MIVNRMVVFLVFGVNRCWYLYSVNIRMKKVDVRFVENLLKFDSL